MEFKDIKTLTYIGNNVNIDGRGVEIETSLPSNIEAVQFHKGRDFCLEEPLMTKVKLSKYQYALDEYVSAVDVIDNQPEVEPTQNELIEKLKTSIQSHIDTQAQELGFDDINSVSKYMGFDNPYRSDAERLASWTANCWVYIESELVKVISGDRTLPTNEEAILELPEYN